MRDDALPIGRIALIGIGIGAAVALAIVVALGMLAHRRVPTGGAPVARPAPLADAVPMLQTAPQLDEAAYREAERQRLDGYGWIDAASGVAHVPIDRAMAELARQGTWKPEVRISVSPTELPAAPALAASTSPAP